MSYNELLPKCISEARLCAVAACFTAATALNTALDEESVFHQVLQSQFLYRLAP